MDQAEQLPFRQPFSLPPSILADLHDDLVRVLREIPERRGLVDEDARARDVMEIYRVCAEHLGFAYDEIEREPDLFLARRVEAQVYCRDSHAMLSVDAFVRQRGSPMEAAKAIIAVISDSSVNTVRRRLKDHEPTIEGMRRERTEAMKQAFFGLLKELEGEGYRLRGDPEEAILGYRPDVRPEMSMSDEQREEMNRRSIEAARARLRNDREFMFGPVARRKVLVRPEKPREE